MRRRQPGAILPAGVLTLSERRLLGGPSAQMGVAADDDATLDRNRRRPLANARAGVGAREQLRAVIAVDGRQLAAIDEPNRGIGGAVGRGRERRGDGASERSAPLGARG